MQPGHPCVFAAAVALALSAAAAGPLEGEPILLDADGTISGLVLVQFDSSGTEALYQPRLPSSDSPLSAARRLFISYEWFDLEAYSRMLAQDFRFMAADSGVRAAYPDGFSRDDEIASAEHLFNGFTNAEGLALPAAQTIILNADTLWAEPDPARPDSPEQYQQVVIPRVQMSVSLADGKAFEVDRGEHVLHMVRGDVARLGAGQKADADHWYVRLWVETLGRIAAVIMAERPERPTGPEDAGTFAAPIDSSAVRDSLARAAAGASGPLAILRLANPARGPIELTYRLRGREPAWIDLYDLAGRRLLRRSLDGQSTGTRSIALSPDTALAPGIYWIQLGQGGSRVVARVAVIR